MKEMELAKENLEMIKNNDKSIKGMNTALKKIPGLRQILITMNKELIENGKENIATKKVVIQISNQDVFKKQNKRTKKTLFDKNFNKIRQIIKLLCLSGSIRKVGYRELTSTKQNEMKSDIKKSNQKEVYFLEKNIYEILDLREADFSRLKGLKNTTNIHYVSIWEQYTKDLADNCFNRPFGDIQHINTQVQLIKTIKAPMRNKKAMPLMELCNNICKFWNVTDNEDHRTALWWKENIKGLNSDFLKSNGFRITTASKLKKDTKKLKDWKANTLMIEKIEDLTSEEKEMLNVG